MKYLTRLMSLRTRASFALFLSIAFILGYKLWVRVVWHVVSTNAPNGFPSAMGQNNSVCFHPRAAFVEPCAQLKAGVDCVRVALNVAGWTALLAALLLLCSWLPSLFTSRHAPRIVAAPGARLHALAGFFCSRKTMERVYGPMLDDMQEEYFEALAEGDLWKARARYASYCWAFMKTLPMRAVLGLVDVVFNLLKYI